ncbi:MAG TPA: hypothetical protein VNK95_06240 [Caldilineaceae bacterium]|nr:hypothetical protein [Caldilineaceae bacterium]
MAELCSTPLFRDTTPEAEATLFALLRQAPPARKLQMVDELNARLRRLMWAGLRERHPTAHADERRRCLAALLLGEALTASVAAYAAERGLAFLQGNTTMIDERASEAALAVIAVLEQLGVPYVVVGSVAAAVHGVARTTQDTDLVAALELEHVAGFVRALQDDYYLSVLAIVAAIQETGSFNLVHLATLFKVDIFIPRPRPFDQAQLRRGRRTVVAAAPERTVVIASPEDTIAAKLEWFRAGGEVSENQWRDVLAILKAQGERLELDYLRRTAQSLGVADLLERALAEAR